MGEDRYRTEDQQGSKFYNGTEKCTAVDVVLTGNRGSNVFNCVVAIDEM
jgi:hypothetical protein